MPLGCSHGQQVAPGSEPVVRRRPPRLTLLRSQKRESAMHCRSGKEGAVGREGRAPADSTRVSQCTTSGTPHRRELATVLSHPVGSSLPMAEPSASMASTTYMNSPPHTNPATPPPDTHTALPCSRNVRYINGCVRIYQRYMGCTYQRMPTPRTAHQHERASPVALRPWKTRSAPR